MNAARYFAVALVLLFAWRGEIGSVVWPPAKRPDVAVVQKPDDEAMGWVAAINANGMTPKDRLYVADFYLAVAYVLSTDGARENRILDSTSKFSAFHAGSLQLAIEKGAVGRYPGLGASIDRAFFAAAGDKDSKAIDATLAARLVRCCEALAWRFTIHADQ